MTTSSKPLVLLHGLATSAQRTWVETGLYDLLTDEGRDVRLIDLPGHGGTPLLADDDWDHLDEWLEHRLDEECPDGPLDAVGFSLGARLLLGVAATRPQRFGRLVIAGVGANLFRHDDHEPLAERIDSGIRASETDPLVGHFLDLAAASGTDPAAVAALLRATRRPIDDLLGRIEAEVLVVIGDRDFAGPADELVEQIGGSTRLVILRGVDHFATPKSMGFLDAVLGFLGTA